MLYSVEDIEKVAKQELDEEAFRAAVEKAKQRIIERRNWPWWRVLFPFRIKLERL